MTQAAGTTPPGEPRPPARMLAVTALAVAATIAAVMVAVVTAATHAELHPGGMARVPDPPAAAPAPHLARSSPALTRDPQHPRRLALASRIDSPSPGAVLAWSADGGADWGHTQLPLPPGLGRPYEPDAAFAPDGTLYVLYTNLHGRGGTPDHLWLSRSADGGRHLDPPVQVAGPLAFEPRLAVASASTLYVTWLQGVGVGQLSLAGPPSPIMAAQSTDGGRTFSAAAQVSDAGRARVGAASPAVASDGSLVVLYEDFGSDRRDFLNLEGPPWPDPFRLVATRSTDGAQSFTPGREVDPAVVPTERFIPYQPPFPSLAAGLDGSLVAAWLDGRNGNPDVLLSRSIDGGGSWSAPLDLADAGAPGGVEHRLPAAAVAPNGRIDVLYLDDARAPSQGRLDAELATSTDGGHHFTSARLSSASFDARVGPVPHAGQIRPGLGSRLGLVSDGEGARAAWTDTGRGSVTDIRQDIATATATVSGQSRAAGIAAATTLGIVAAGAALAVLAMLRPARAAAVRARAAGLAAAGSGYLWRPPPGAPVARARTAPPARRLRLGRRSIAIVLPSWRDPRLHVAACLLSVQVLGQVTLGFELSVAQILVSLGTCAVIELAITAATTRMVVWPASALLTGNGVALLLRVPGTPHGDWWSLHGAALYAGVSAVSLLSKYVVRWRGRHLFNPSNIGLVLCFLVFGEAVADPQDLWFGRMSPGLVLTYAIIVVGGVLIVRRLRMLPLALAFMGGFALLIGAISLAGHCVSARWSVGPVCGGYFWSTVIFSPEILIFVLFMITDPQTTPPGRVGRTVFGFAVAFTAALLAAPQQTEQDTKIAILSALVVVCALQPALRRYLPSPGSPRDRLRAWLGWRPGRALAGLLAPAVAAALLLGCAGLVAAAGAPARHPAATGADLAALRAVVAARPAVALPPGSVPLVEVAPEVRAADTSLSDAAAQRIGRDVVEDLAIGSQALERLDPRLARTAAYGSWLQGWLRDIQAARTDGRRTVPEYRVGRLRLVLASNPDDYQASKEVAVELEGVVEQVVRGGGDQVLGRSQASIHRVLALQVVGEHHLIAADYSRR